MESTNIRLEHHYVQRNMPKDTIVLEPCPRSPKWWRQILVLELGLGQHSHRASYQPKFKVFIN